VSKVQEILGGIKKASVSDIKIKSGKVVCMVSFETKDGRYHEIELVVDKPVSEWES